MAPRRVKALYDYVGKHTDELNFTKGDIITLTQPAHDGWFEGTLRGLTGWFPANYICEYRGDSELSPLPAPTNENRQKVLLNIIETEAAFVEDLDCFMNSTLQPLWRLFGEDYDLIYRNLEAILQTHRTLLSGLRGEASREPSKIGRVFQAVFSRLKGVHSNYSALHPKIIKLLMRNTCVINNNQPDNMLNVTSGLSAPLKRLEKYETLLEELTRHTPENHSDRGECQRSCNLFGELAWEMNAVRKQKDIETEILYASIRNWEGPPISSLGEVRAVCAIRAQCNGSTKDYFLLAFDTVIIFVSLMDSNEFQLEFKFPLERTTVSVEMPQTLELQFQNQKLLVTFQSTEDFEKVRSRVDVYSTVQKRTSSRSTENSFLLRSNGSRPVTPELRLDVSKQSWNSARISRPTSPASLPPTFQRPNANLRADSICPSTARTNHLISRLRGVLPHRRAKIPLQKEAVPGLKRGSSARKNKKDLPAPILFEESLTNPSHYERDLQILKMVELFANLSRKPTIPLGGVTSTSVIALTSLPSVRVSTMNSHNNPSGVDVDATGHLVRRPKSISPITSAPLSDLGTLRALQSDVTTLKEQVAKLQTELQEERKQRKALQDYFHSLSLRNRT